MNFELNIDYSVEKTEKSWKRMEARGSYQYVDRVPVGFCVVPRYFTPIFKIPYNTIFKSVQEHYHWQLQFLKYRIENIPEDMICTSTTLWVGPYFDNILDSAAFGAEIAWPENETLHSRPVITSVEQMERFPVPKPGSGLWGQAIEWAQQMREFAKNTRLTFNNVEGKITVMSPAMFKEFCVPYSNRLFDASTSRGIHMCGSSTHLHRALLDDMRMTSFDLFGYVVDPKVAANFLGGQHKEIYDHDRT